MIAHSLDSGSEGFNLLLLLRDGRLELGDCALLFCNFALLFCDVPMLLQELIEQHRVHSFVTDSVWLSVLAPNH